MILHIGRYQGGWARRAGGGKIRVSARNRSVANGVRSWWLAYEAKLRCRSTSVAMRSDMTLNVVTRLRSSGGPVTRVIRSPNRPAASARAPSSRSRTGRVTQFTSGCALASPTSRTAALAAPAAPSGARSRR